MATISMELNSIDPVDSSAGEIYHNTVSLSAGTYSDTYLLPIKEVSAIGLEIDGDGAIEFSIDPPSVLSTGAPTFSAWDGFSWVNPAVTGFRVKRNSGTVTAKVTVRTANV